MNKSKKQSHVRGNKTCSGQQHRPQPPRNRHQQDTRPRGKPRPDTNRRYDSTAPYNFVPLPESPLLVDKMSEFEIVTNFGRSKIWVSHDLFAESKHSGFIELTLTTETETYVRCAQAPRMNSKESTVPVSDFFSYGNPVVPIIPGSSIRGMVRTLVEILSFGKFVNLDDSRQLIYRAVGDKTSHGDYYRNRLLGPNRPELGEKFHFDYPTPDMHGGFLKKNGTEWVIIPSKESEGESIVHIPCEKLPNLWGPRTERCHSDPVKDRPKKVYVISPSREPSERGSDTFILEIAIVEHVSLTKAAGYEEVWVIPSGYMKNKKFFRAIYEKDETVAAIPIPREYWEIYSDDADISRGLPNRRLRDGNPLFYLLDDSRVSKDNPSGLVFFGPTMMFRLPYNKTIGEHIPAALRGEGTDMAEALFGTVRSADKTAIRGRVRFGDATVVMPESGSPFLDPAGGPVVPKILSGPKPTSFQHYLEQKTNDKKQLLDWDSDSPLRGHKMYWHKNKVRIEDILEKGDMKKLITEIASGKDKMHTLIRPVKRGVSFKSRVYFDNLCDLEIGALLTALILPPTKRHKIGMGKPLGMGTVKVEARLKLISRSRRYEALFDSEGAPNKGWVQQKETEEAAAKARATFEGLILKHAGAQTKHIWDIPRLKRLGEILEWDSAPPMSKTAYMELARWKDRNVLPRADCVKGSNTPLPSNERT